MAQPTRKMLAQALLPTINKSTDPAKLAKSIAQYLVQARRINEVDGLMRDVTSLREQSGIIEVTVTSAFPLNQVLKRDIRMLVTKQRPDAKVIINEVIDPSVLGGVKLETSEQQLDVTVQSKLESLKRAIV